jgi:hypothetical protein
MTRLISRKDMAFGGMYGLKELKKAIKAKEKTT